MEPLIQMQEPKQEEPKVEKKKRQSVRKKEIDKKVRVTMIKATSRMAVKIMDNYYTIEYTEERSVPPVDDINLELEKSRLFDSVNQTVDTQVEEIARSFQK